MNHTHSIVRQEGPLPFEGSVVCYPFPENRRAHGGVRFRLHCECGAYRDVNVNGNAQEVSQWRRQRRV